MKNILVTGAAGFVGRHLMAELANNRNYASFGLDMQRPRFIQYPLMHIDVVSYIQDFGNMCKWDVVVHLAANIVNLNSRMQNRISSYEDVVIDYAMCHWLQKIKPERVVLMSSCAIDGANDPYSAVKRNLEAMAMTLHASGIETIILRPFSGYGGDQSSEYPFPAILGRALQHEDPLMIWGSGLQVRDWLYITDLVDAIMYAIDGMFPSGQPIDIGTGRGISFLDVAKIMSAAVGYEPVITCDTTKPMSTEVRIADTSLAKKYQWEATITFEQGLEDVLNASRAVSAETR